MEDLVKEKFLLRQKVKEFYNLLSEEAYKERCEKISKEFLKILVHWTPGSWGLVVPFGDEPNFEKYLNKKNPGYEDFGHSFFLCDWSKDAENMKYVDEDGNEVIPDYLLVPGRCFTKSGARLGRGRGYFDRYLQDFEGQTVGFCFEEQIFDHIPEEEHDIRVQYLVTEENFYECS